MSNKQLDKTLKVNDETYDVNAVYSDEAGKTSKNLKIKNQIDVNVNKTVAEVVTFNGSKDVDLAIVPAEGGEFSGPIKVPSHSSTKPIENESVLNYEELLKLIGQLTGSPVFGWDGTNLTGKLDDDGLRRIGIIIGTETSVEKFAKKNHENEWLPFYLYITTEIDNTDPENPRLTGNIYYGNCDTDAYFKLSADAEIATKLAKFQSIIVDLSTGAVGTFNGSEDKTISVGVVNSLSVSNGGTGAKDAQGACNNLITNQNIAPGIIKVTDPDNSGQAKHKRNGRFGIDLNNSDIVGLNALYFASATDSPNKGINFVSENNESKTTYDRLYSQAGKLYYQPDKKITNNNITADRYEVYHSGGASEPIPENMGGTGKKTLSSVSVGHAATLTTYVCETHGSLDTLNIKTRIIASEDAPDDAKDGIEGDIWIQYSTT